jgi:transcriptional regulator with PAS, ATPase and Fis domain
VEHSHLSWSSLLTTLEGFFLLLEEGGHIEAASKGAASALGYTEASLKAKTIFEVNPKVNMLEWQRRWGEMKEGKLRKVETIHLTADQQLIPVDVRACVLNIGGEERALYMFSGPKEEGWEHQLIQLGGEFLEATFFSWDWDSDTVRFWGSHQRWWQEELPTSGKELLTFLRQKAGSSQSLQLLQSLKDVYHRKAILRQAISLTMASGKDQLLDCWAQPVFKEGILQAWLGVLHRGNIATESETRSGSYRIGLDHSLEAILQVDREGRMRYGNTASSKLLADAAGKNWLKSLQTEEWETWDEFWLANRPNDEVEFEGKLLRTDKADLPVRVFVRWVSDQEAFIYLRSLASQREKEEELEQALGEVQRLKKKLEDEKSYLQEELDLQYNFRNIITHSESYKLVLKKVEQVAKTSATVLILGETGTGKELLARAIHNYSERKESALVKLNCSVLPKDLVESELFGHERGAFTGAVEQKIGRFELADGGTLFLDEVGELPLELQAKLLRVLQEGEFERVGGTETLKVDVRVVAATNRDLEQRVESGEFREDLYYRLNVFPIYNIPLRERREDIPYLVQHFLNKYAGRVGKTFDKIPKRALSQLMKYDFPGNIRELENMVERAMILSEGEKLRLDVVLSGEQGGRRSDTQLRRFPTFEEMQRDHIVEALKRTNWRVSGDLGAARILQLNSKTLYSKMRKLGIRREDYVDLE